jgi:hypothetical protein
MRNHRRKRRIFRRLALGVAVAAVAVPSAQAQLHEREATETGYRYLLSSAGYPAPGERDWPGVDPNAVPNEARRRSGPLLLPKEARPRPGRLPGRTWIRPARSHSSIDWGDTGIGAGTMFAIVLLAAGGVLVTRHLNRGATA